MIQDSRDLQIQNLNSNIRVKGERKRKPVKKDGPVIQTYGWANSFALGEGSIPCTGIGQENGKEPIHVKFGTARKGRTKTGHDLEESTARKAKGKWQTEGTGGILGKELLVEEETKL